MLGSLYLPLPLSDVGCPGARVDIEGLGYSGYSRCIREDCECSARGNIGSTGNLYSPVGKSCKNMLCHSPVVLASRGLPYDESKWEEEGAEAEGKGPGEK